MQIGAPFRMAGQQNARRVRGLRYLCWGRYFSARRRRRPPPSQGEKAGEAALPKDAFVFSVIPKGPLAAATFFENLRLERRSLTRTRDFSTTAFGLLEMTGWGIQRSG
jgi:hypothetical protein